MFEFGDWIQAFEAIEFFREVSDFGSFEYSSRSSSTASSTGKKRPSFLDISGI